MTTSYPDGIEITAPVTPEFAEILTPEALAFVAKLERAHAASSRVDLVSDDDCRRRRFAANE